MTGRERVRRAIEFDGPDRIPVLHYIYPGAYWRYGEALLELLREQPWDFGPEHLEKWGQPWVDTGMPSVHEFQVGCQDDIEEYWDEWGCFWRRKKGYSAGEVKGPALPTWEEWKSYQFPPPLPEWHFEDLRQRMEASNHSWYVLAGGGNLFERMQMLRGTENLLLDLAEEREELHELADRMVGWMLTNIQNYLRVGVDGIGFGDDWGSQRSLLIRPEQWRNFFKPRYRRMFSVIKEAGAHIHFHTDGWTRDIFDDFLEIGVDVLNPQHHLMGTREVGKRLGGRVCIRSDLDRQYILPYGSPQDVREHVKEVIEAFGNFNGGLILFGDIGLDTPFENIRAMYDAFGEFGLTEAPTTTR